MTMVYTNPCNNKMCYIGTALYSHYVLLLGKTSIKCINVLSWFTRRYIITVKPVLSDHSKIDKTKILMTNGSLMKVENIAECSF